VVVGNQNDAIPAPDAGVSTELALEDADRARPADVVRHEHVGPNPHVVARGDCRLAGGTREDLLGHRHGAHGPTSTRAGSRRYWRRYSSLLSAFTYASALAWMMSVWLPCPVTT